MNINKFIDKNVRLILNDPATGEWQIYTWEWRQPYRADSFTKAISMAMLQEKEKKTTWEIWNNEKKVGRVTADTLEQAVALTNPNLLNFQYKEVV